MKTKSTSKRKKLRPLRSNGLVRHHRTEKCETCNGLGWYLVMGRGTVRRPDCEDCNGKGRRPVTPNVGAEAPATDDIQQPKTLR